MPGSFVFKPMQAHLSHNRSHLGEMKPYCEYHLGQYKIQGQIAQANPLNPHWTDVTIINGEHETKCKIEVKDKATLKPSRMLAECVIDLDEIRMKGEVTKWIELYHEGEKEGELFIEIRYIPDDEAEKEEENSMEKTDTSMHFLLKKGHF